MGWVKSGGALGLLLMMASAGCQNKLYDQNKALYDENKALREQNDSLRHQQTTAPPPAVAPAPQAAMVAPQPQPEPASPPLTETPVAKPLVAPRPVEKIGGMETTVNPRTGNTTVHLPSDVFFDSGQATLRQSAKASLDKVAADLKKRFPDNKIVVEGHTDKQPIRVSKWSSNQELSEARAEAVKKYLASRGIPSSQLTTKGYGDTKPRSATDLSKNRRVEIVVLKGH